MNILRCGITVANVVLETTNSSDKHGVPFLLRLIHGLYEDVEGGVEDTLVKDNSSNSSSTANRIDRKGTLVILRTAIVNISGIGMRLEDIAESLLCCACSIEDELTMTKLAEEVIQVSLLPGVIATHPLVAIV